MTLLVNAIYTRIPPHRRWATTRVAQLHDQCHSSTKFSMESSLKFHRSRARMPCVSNQGRNGPSLSGGLGGVGCMTCSLLVTIAIAALDRRTEAMANPLYPAVFGSDIK